MDAGTAPPPARTIGAREFKDNCLQILREVNESGEAVLVTRHKVPIARITAPEPEHPVGIFGRCAGELTILGDIVAPAFDPDDFDMETRLDRVLDPGGYDQGH
jgi:antitoxin (DNA-binding transcriptional repressor) of toxin-antitoxin stability system